MRWDFFYAGDDLHADGVFMIWPEFLSLDGEVLSEGEVPMQGLTNMFIVDSGLIPFHRKRVSLGTNGYFMEGTWLSAQVSKVISLLDEHAL